MRRNVSKKDSSNEQSLQKPSVQMPPPVICCQQNKTQSTTFGILLIISVCVLLTAVNIYELRRIESSRQIIVRDIPQQQVPEVHTVEEKRPTYWVYGKGTNTGYLKHVFAVLDRLGYRKGSNESDWDLLWAHDYPFRVFYHQLYNLKPHQRVNHFPGCGYITNKVDLATSDIKHIPIAFKMPENKKELFEYVEKNPKKLFVQKSNAHRGIKIESIASLDFNNSETFIQEYIDKPFLVDGYKFDVGIYTIITSLEPLRVYIYNGDVLFRYCLVKYYPFDPKNIDKYVVGDDYLPTWEVPSLKKFYNELGFSMKESFDAHVRSLGKNPQKAWDQVENAIREICLKKSGLIHNTITSRFKSKQTNFFEMVRFDFVFDEDLNAYVMEANMSPNLSSAHYPPNQLLYEQVLFNALSLVGIANKLRKPSLAIRSNAEELMQVAEKNIVVYPSNCVSKLCEENCDLSECELCLPCLDSAQKEIFSQAYKEHLNRGDCKRIFPPHLDKTEENYTSVLQDLTRDNQIMFKWFLGKCILDSKWC